MPRLLPYHLLPVLLLTGWLLHAHAISDLTPVSYASDGGPQLALSDLTSAYLLIQPSVSMSLTKLPLTSALISSLTSQSQDFGLLSSQMTDAQALAYPTLQMFPVMAFPLVPIYRLDGLGAGAPQLVLTRPVLARIFLGSITWWNDSSLHACNPSLTLPAQRITVVLPMPGVPSNRVWTLALGKFYPPFNATVPASDSPAWPFSAYHAAVVTASVTAQPSTVIATDGSIGFTYQPVAVEAGATVAAMVNRAGSTVQPTDDSVSFAAVELGTAERSRTTAFMDLTDAEGTSAWPIAMMSFLLIDTAFSRSTCHVRAAVVEFWLWFYSSPVVKGLLNSRQYAQVPSIVLTQLAVVQQLSTAVLCRGAVALPTAVTTTRIISAPPSVYFLSTLFANLYQTQDATVSWTVQESADQLAVQQFIDGEVDIAFVNPSNVDADLMATVFSSTAVLTLPMFLLADVTAYNPQLTANVSTAGYTMTLDWHTIGLIQYSCIQYWNDPRILRQNPWLAPLLPPITVQPIQIQLITGCDATPHQAPLEDALLAALTEYQLASGDEELTQCISNYPDFLNTAWYECTSVPSYGIVYAPVESTVPALVSGTIGAMGVLQASGDTTLSILQVTDTRSGVTVNTTASLSAMAACASDTFNAGFLMGGGNPLLLSAGSQNPNCYRPTQQVMALLRPTYSSTRSDSTGCVRGYDSLRFMQWFIATQPIDALVNSVNAVRVTSLSSSVFNAEWRALQGVLCDEQTLLVTLPVQWTLALGVYDFVTVVSTLGLVACGLLAGWVVHYRHHPMVRSASPLFLLLSLVGLMVMFAAGYTLVAPVSTASCSAFSWLVNIGLMLTFAPLFAKTWRIYRIFGRKKLSVVAIPNKKLLMMVGTLLALELLVMAVWQGIGNLQPQTNDVQTSTPVSSPVAIIAARMQVDEYVQCGVPSGAPRSMFIVVCVEKALLFVWGAMMAFSTRKVSSTFNEAQGITLALYNTIFTIGVIAPIILVIGATGDVLDLLLAFALLWISGFTVATLFGPKVLTVMSKKSDAVQGMNTSVAGSSSSGSGYAFMSLAALSSISVLQVYLVAIKKHVAQVEQKLAKLRLQSSPTSPLERRASNKTSSSPVPGEKRLVEASERKMLVEASLSARSPSLQKTRGLVSDAKRRVTVSEGRTVEGGRSESDSSNDGER